MGRHLSCATRMKRKRLPRIARRVTVTKELLGENVEAHEVFSQGASLLERMFSLIYFADFVTIYLAYLYGVCPTDIAAIDHLKAEMSKIVGIRNWGLAQLSLSLRRRGPG